MDGGMTVSQWAKLLRDAEDERDRHEQLVMMSDLDWVQDEYREFIRQPRAIRPCVIDEQWAITNRTTNLFDNVFVWIRKWYGNDNEYYGNKPDLWTWVPDPFFNQQDIELALDGHEYMVEQECNRVGDHYNPCKLPKEMVQWFIKWMESQKPIAVMPRIRTPMYQSPQIIMALFDSEQAAWEGFVHCLRKSNDVDADLKPIQEVNRAKAKVGDYFI